MNKVTWIFVAFFCWCLFASGQNIRVKVFEEKSKNPLAMVMVIGKEDTKIHFTNETGIVELTPSTAYEFRLWGYQSKVLNWSDLAKASEGVALSFSEIRMDELLVTANRWHQSAQRVLPHVVSFKSKDIKFYDPQTAADLLGLTGQVFIQKSQQAGGSPMINGFSTNRLLYAVDGVRMNTAIFRTGNIQNVINIDPFAQEKVEVLIGPGSTSYGSDAIGGVMSFNSLEAKLSPDENWLIKGNGTLRFSSANSEATGHADLLIAKKRFASMTSFSNWQFGDLVQGSHGPNDYIKSSYVDRQDTTDVVINQKNPLTQTPSGYSQQNVMQKFRFKPNRFWDIQYTFHLSRTTDYGRYDRHNRYKSGLPRYGEWFYGPQLWSMHVASLTHQSNRRLYDQLILKAAYQQFEESRNERAFNNPIRSTQTERVGAYSLNLDLLKNINNRFSLTYGGEGVLNNVHSEGKLTNLNNGLVQIGPSRYPNSNWLSLAAFVNPVYMLSKKILLVTGLRYNHYQLNADFSNNLAFYPFPFSSGKLSNSALTGNAGLILTLKNKFSLRTNVETAFRSPNVDDMGKVFDSQQGTVTVPNPNLSAEYAYTFNVGIAKIIKDAIKLDVNTYYTYLNHALVLRPTTFDGKDSMVYKGVMSKIQSVQNAAYAYVYGMHFSMDVSLPAGFSITGDVNYQKGEEELANGQLNPLRSASPLFGMLRCRYRYHRLTLEIYNQYQASFAYDQLAEEEKSKTELYAKDANGKPYAPQWYTINFRGMCQFNEKMRLNLGIENITDQRYRPYSSGISGAGRNYIIAMSIGF